jgi:hypothetical protein
MIAVPGTVPFDEMLVNTPGSPWAFAGSTVDKLGVRPVVVTV